MNIPIQPFRVVDRQTGEEFTITGFQERAVVSNAKTNGPQLTSGAGWMRLDSSDGRYVRSVEGTENEFDLQDRLTNKLTRVNRVQ